MGQMTRPNPGSFFDGTSSSHGLARPSERARSDRTPVRLVTRRVSAFIAAGGICAYMAFEGASYDVVARQQVALIVWSLVALGFAFGVMPRGRPSPWALAPLLAGLGLAVWMAIGLTWTGSSERTTAEIARVLIFLGLMSLAIASLNKHTFRAAAAGLSVAAGVVTVCSVASRLDPSLFPNALELASRFPRLDRLDFPLDYWNAVGTWGAMTAALGTVWSAHAKSGLVRGIALSIVPVAGAAIYLSYSRGGVLATAVALVSVVVLSRNRWTVFIHALAAGAGAALAILVIRSNPEIANATGGAGGSAVALSLIGAAVLCFGAVFTTWIVRADDARLPQSIPTWAVRTGVGFLVLVSVIVSHGPVTSAWNEFRTEDSATRTADPAARLTSTGGNRDDVWSSALDAYRSEPLVGIGAGTFEFWWEQHGDDSEYVRDAHSLYLEILAETGIVGLGLLLTFLIGALVVALRARRDLESSSDFGAHASMISVFLVFLVSAGVDWMWEETAVAASALGGLAIAMSSGSSRLRREQRRGQLGRFGVRPIIVGAAVAAAIFQVPGLVATERTRASEDALATGDVAGARSLAQDAIDAEPWSATAHSQLAIAARAGGDLRVAGDEAAKAAEREPTNWRWPLLRAVIQAQAGHRKAAVATFKEGRSLAPNLISYAPFSELRQAVLQPRTTGLGSTSARRRRLDSGR